MSFDLFTALSTGLSTIFALAALVTAVFAYRKANEVAPQRLKMRVTELEAMQERLEEWFKKLNASYALIIARSKKQAKNEEETANGELDFHQSSNETPEQWKARMRAQLATGGLKHK